MSPTTTTATARLTVAQALVRFLSAQYTERDGERRRLIGATWGIFGHGNVAGLGQALIEYADDMPYLQGRNEQSMVHAAVGYARQSNRLSTHAVTTSIGPGATNLVTGAALATINHLPVLLLPGDIFATRPADPVLQQLEVPYAGDISVNDTLRPVSRYFDRITRPEALIPAALQAMRVLTDPVETGAVTLALPQDVQAEAYDWPEEFFAERTWTVRRPAADVAELAGAIDAIRAARRPLIVAGGGVHHARAEEALAELADATGIPVASTQAGKGSLRFDHPQDVGGIGHTGTATADELARTADLVIGVGTRYTDFTTASNTLFAADGVRFLNLNIAPYDGHKLSALPLIADARAGLEALSEALEVHGHRVADGYVAEYTEDKQRWEHRVDACYEADEPDTRPTQAQVLGLLDELVDESDILINAAGSLPGDLHKLWRTRSRDQYHLEYGYSCMGYEIPAAIGVRLAAPGRPVWALVGDGTYLMMPTEIVTAVQENVPIKVLLVQNHGYASIGGLSESVGGERFGTAYRHRDPDDGTFTGAPLPVDLAANAASLGMRVLRAKTVRELRAALAEARAADTPTCVYVETQTADTVSGPPPAQAWWDVPVAETATRASAVKAREEYDRHVSTRRRHL
ncbi:MULTISPECIES: 3D-(3,5/4)-trihydroxycyclohexane-1,2-dione acylhydrolase (decyclizing) [Streptomyces]|uniref:3D-(3,5/4)-trihydroxycyclohexane-1,2-dione acylhydrolase (Decyclizing) n=1 Tax=Streptomyces caniscabiei TaxID=2746961 RepID=A0ABU4MXE2_9ACTN|nr:MULTISPECIES: 3D-(3,5/4)-trihydroxycyclohexane-1,2-dione acylhydrolase (decyclizing) [Streptomyces]MBE4739457.1 3D-(3,5/4)-trihydroxycyclohexane-1,2-dione acylhydrolase (decyclizing) [Streptomyces caniscabiei]MBE4759979.1 3D-(3,5/4)-trihydroxycyclohexane-1,2-dione acylhydrolase (decyclizing) [Streptomyces caniscabiei]MBE4784609.1 3D-(3,5/4)-trihydroxycyclohexane-1,2-dione acylhydrolase (decyclizing) [Streptomyces caniscabiei]MBE4798147.1 3D-(3,5/4)-trihydroxycyclohexane-1,2-dione acylhydrola